ncbi:hypothetical protein [Lysobacter antibioticus]|uniref:hypothetical protein n=1 Tax=Lysobacter antibioticus TaxID=84531 RepID=UPI0011873FBD|nr:hypothetical protein [Lysobacter antibioticus]
MLKFRLPLQVFSRARRCAKLVTAKAKAKAKAKTKAKAVAVAIAVRRPALAKAMEGPEGGAQGCAPLFIGTGMSRMKKPCVCTARAGL